MPVIINEPFEDHASKGSFHALFFNGMGDIGQVVTKPFQVRDQIDKYAAGFRFAGALIQALDMTVNEFFA